MFGFFHTESKYDETIMKDIALFEKENGVCLPYLLTYIYTHYVDRKMDVREFDLQDGFKMEVSKILPLAGEGYTVTTAYREERIDGFISSDNIPFAMDRGGNLYYWKSNYVDNDLCGKCPVIYISADDCDNEVQIAEDVLDFFYKISNSNVSNEEASDIYKWIHEYYNNASDEEYENVKNKLLQIAKS